MICCDCRDRVFLYFDWKSIFYLFSFQLLMWLEPTVISNSMRIQKIQLECQIFLPFVPGLIPEQAIAKVVFICFTILVLLLYFRSKLIGYYVKILQKRIIGSCNWKWDCVVGMSDLLSPFVVLFEDDGDAFWCFVMLLRRMVLF